VQDHKHMCIGLCKLKIGLPYKL